MSQTRLYGQCWQPWRDEIYSSSGTLTFCAAGCLVTALTSLATYAGYDVEPPEFADRIDDAGAFEGDYLKHPSRVTAAYPKLVWYHNKCFYSPKYDRYESSLIDWSVRPVDLELLSNLLKKYPVIVQVDYKPSTPEVDTHFVLALEYIPGDGIEDDLRIVDPLTGTITSSHVYFEPKWNYESAIQEGRTTRVARTLMGARVWEVRDGTPPVTKKIRGVHGSVIKALPQDPPGDGNWWIAEMQAMNLSWFKTMSLNPDWHRRLIAAGITPIVRLHQHQQFPRRLDAAQFDMVKLLIAAGVRYFEIGNEPNLPGEWRPAYQPIVSWHNSHLVALVAENWWLDAQEIIRLGGKPGFYAMAPTDRNGTHPTCSSVMWVRKLVYQLAATHCSEITQLTKEGKIWVAVHVSPFNRDFDFNPNRGTFIDDMCLRGYEPTHDLWTQTFGAEPEMMSTESGVFSPDHMRYLGWEPNYTDETWGDKQVEMFEWLEREGKLAAMMPWTLSDCQLTPDHPFCGCGWYGPNNEARSPVEAMKQ